MAELAGSFGCRLGLWGGPDGFGNTPEEEKARTEMLVSLCRDYGFKLFKLDAVCGQLRDGKQDAFARAMAECRKHAPDLIVLNHRLNLNEESRKHATTFLWGGKETYIDVHMANVGTATHSEVDLKALARLSGDRRVEMAPLKEVQPLTGYIRGGVTALACKKDYPVFADEHIRNHPVIAVSAGVRGTQILLAPDDYLRATKANVGPIARTAEHG